jgi:hypothetical protein
VTDGTGLTLPVLGLNLPLSDVRIGALYFFGTPLRLQTGLIRGFLSHADAENLVIPPAWPHIGGLTLASALPGGTGNCATHNDMDVGPDPNSPGWWLHFNFIAAPVPFDEPPSGVTPIATHATLSPAYPNPFNPTVTIACTLPEPAYARLTVHTMAGALVAKLVDGNLPAGTNDVRWDGDDRQGHAVSSGVYVVRLQTGGDTVCRKIVLLK